MPENSTISPPVKNGALGLIYILGFLAYFQTYLPLYINSSFLDQFLTERIIGLVFTIGSAISIVTFLATPRIIEKIGLFAFGMGFGALSFLSLLLLALVESPIFLVASFISGLVFIRLLLYSLDILLEEHSTDKKTGSIRGTFLTVTNIALIISPLLAGLIIGEAELYQRIYLVAAVIIAITLALLMKPLTEASKKHSAYRPALMETLRRIKKNKDIYSIFMSNMILRVFYAGMVVYTPIYLHQYVGFSWSEIGVIFTIMLLPFVLLEYPLGRIADTKLGEKEILSAGFICIGLFTALLSFISTPSLALWAGLLLLTRVGASAVEIMSEAYFFKKINWNDSDLLSFFRMVDPIAYILTPLFVSILLYFLDFRWIFVVLGIIAFFGLRYSFGLKDTM